MSKLRELVNQINGLWAPQERPFTSQVPLVGPIIVLFRTAWNWASTKWYVKPILEQQIAFNSAAVQIINEMANALERLEAQGARLEEGLAQLRVQFEGFADQTSAHLGRLEEALGRRVQQVESSLNNQVREAEEWIIANDRTSTALARDLAGLTHRLNEVAGKLPVEMADLKERLTGLEEALRRRAAVGEG